MYQKPSPAEKVASWSGANTMTDEESNALYGLSCLLIHRYHANPQNSTSSFRGTPWRSPFSAGEGLYCVSVRRYSSSEPNLLFSSLTEGAVAIRRLGEFCVHYIDTNSFRRLTAPPPSRIEVKLDLPPNGPPGTSVPTRYIVIVNLSCRGDHRSSALKQN